MTTIELSLQKAAMARENIAHAGLGKVITQLEDDAGAWPAQAPEASAALRRVLRPGGLLVVDNASSHAHEMADFVDAVTNDGGFTTGLVPVGKGEFLAVKA